MYCERQSNRERQHSRHKLPLRDVVNQQRVAKRRHPCAIDEETPQRVIVISAFRRFPLSPAASYPTIQMAFLLTSVVRQ